MTTFSYPFNLDHIDYDDFWTYFDVTNTKGQHFLLSYGENMVYAL